MITQEVCTEHADCVVVYHCESNLVGCPICKLLASARQYAESPAPTGNIAMPKLPHINEVLKEAGCEHVGYMSVTNQAMVSAVTKAYFFIERQLRHS